MEFSNNFANRIFQTILQIRIFKHPIVKRGFSSNFQIRFLKQPTCVFDKKLRIFKNFWLVANASTVPKKNLIKGSFGFPLCPAHLFRPAASGGRHKIGTKEPLFGLLLSEWGLILPWSSHLSVSSSIYALQGFFSGASSPKNIGVK